MQQLAAVRMLFDWLITGQVVPINPAAAVRDRACREDRQDAGARRHANGASCIDSIPVDTVRDLRDRALIATLTYSFARIARGAEIEGGGSPAVGRRLAAAAARERREGSRDAVPPCARRGAARLHRRGRHRRGSQGLAVSHQPAAHRHGADRAADGCRPMPGV